jgi:hypothetical protein
MHAGSIPCKGTGFKRYLLEISRQSYEHYHASVSVLIHRLRTVIALSRRGLRWVSIELGLGLG